MLTPQHQTEVGSMAKVTIYCRDYCPYCVSAKALLKSKKQDFEEIKISTSSKEFQDLAEKTGMRTVPQVFIDDRFIGGFSELSQLDKQGDLDPLLKA